VPNNDDDDDDDDDDDCELREWEDKCDIVQSGRVSRKFESKL
jgi:hypothetical protein